MYIQLEIESGEPQQSPHCRCRTPTFNRLGRSQSPTSEITLYKFKGKKNRERVHPSLLHSISTRLLLPLSLLPLFLLPSTGGHPSARISSRRGARCVLLDPLWVPAVSIKGAVLCICAMTTPIVKARGHTWAVSRRVPSFLTAPTGLHVVTLVVCTTALPTSLCRRMAQVTPVAPAGADGTLGSRRF